MSDVKIQYTGKVARFKGADTNDAYQYLKSIKTKSDRLWYMIVEKQDNGLTMLKYNSKAQLCLDDFVRGLKYYYKDLYKDNVELCEALDGMFIIGEDSWVSVANIPNEVGGVKLFSKLMEDLTTLLSSDKME